MNNKYKRVPTQFAPETCFAVDPLAPVPFRGTQETELDRLKRRLLRESLERAGSLELYAPLRRASNEAAALAWTTPFPLLLLPELFREKAEQARRYAQKQSALLQRRTPVMGEAA